MNENFLCMSEEQIWCVWTIAISKLKVVKQVIMNGAFLAHLNRRLKWAFLIKICPLSVVVIVVVFVFIVLNFSHFDLLLQNQWANFNQTWHELILMWRGFKFVQMKGHALFQVEIITELWKYIDKFKKSSSP